MQSFPTSHHRHPPPYPEEPSFPVTHVGTVLVTYVEKHEQQTVVVHSYPMRRLLLQAICNIENKCTIQT